MPADIPPSHLLIIDIDGLRQDVFYQALEEKRLPHIGRLVGGREAARGIHFAAVSTLPSVTFPSQTSFLTGLQPAQHGIAGNQFFDRFGLHNQGVPRFYAFDIGDTLILDDAVRVYSDEAGLLGETLDKTTLTLPEQFVQKCRSAGVVYHMLGRGATTWARPALLDMARFQKGGALFGLTPQAFDEHMLANARRLLVQHPHPDLLLVYFLGLDHHAHTHGPEVEMDYLCRVVDEQVGNLLKDLRRAGWMRNTLTAIVSDHGQIAVIEDDRHSLRLSFPFDREMAYLFDALHLDVHDYPGEGPDCDAVVASNGGTAHVYLQNRQGQWKDAPHFTQDVLPVAQAFWDANQTGIYCSDLQDALAMILARNVEQDGWRADYQVFTPAGLQPVGDFLAQHPQIQTVDAVARLQALAGPASGDLLLVSNFAGGFYFGAPVKGTHGGLHPDDSLCVLSLAWSGASPKQVAHLRQTAESIVSERKRAQGRQYASPADLVPVVQAVMK